MKNSPWSSRIVFRYILLQLPLAVLLFVLYVASKSIREISSNVVLYIFIFWTAKDIFLYPFVWRAYGPERHKKRQDMVGKTGITQQRLHPTGYIRIGPELWRAEAVPEENAIDKNVRVKVYDLKGLLLYVKKLENNG